MGGEKLKQRMCSTAIAGSPPRGRGKDKLNVREDFAPGITPAWAGKSRLCIVPCICFGDHPRVGGEKLWSNGLRWCWVGSPPRGRGKAEHESRKNRFPGITPAWAGKSCGARLDAGHRRDHPRVGGEKTTDRPQGQATAGSPPRGRGKAPPPAGGGPLPGITPAWAGKRVPPVHGPSAAGDHPRVGGEKVQILLYEDIQKGSPPRGRGKVPETYRYVAGYGITPAWAGKRKPYRLK